jgi:hypothetical protein
MADADAFLKALKQARLSEAAQLDAVLNLRDARVLRLEALRDAVLPELQGHAEAQSLFDLNVQDGEKPRLWIDLVSSVEMEPDPKTYRLVQQREGRRDVLFETRDMSQMGDFVIRFLAHRLVAQERLSRTPQVAAQTGRRYGLFEMVYVWITGILFGALSLIAWALATGHLKF